MTEHVEALAAEHGVTIRWISDWRRAESYPEAMQAMVPRIRTGSDYMVALHEIGHCASPESARLARAKDTYGHVLCEGAAWAWATAASKRSLTRRLTNEDWAVVGAAVGSHIAWASMQPSPKRRRTAP